MRRAAVFAFALVLTGCFHFESAIHVEPDGSGTLTERFEVRGLAAMFMEADSTGDGILDRERLLERADALGVRLDSVVLLGATGYQAYFGFADVNRLAYVLDDGAFATKEDEADPDAVEEPEDDRGEISFAFAFEPAGDGPATLQVLSPPRETSAEPTPEPEALPDSSRQKILGSLPMLRAAMGDLRMNVRITVGGQIVDSDASHADSTGLTLAAIDFRRVLDHIAEAPEAAGALGLGDQGDTGPADFFSRDVPGVAFERQEVVTVTFQ